MQMRIQNLRKKISMWLLIGILLMPTAILAQSDQSSAPNSQTIQSADDDLKDCSEMLDKTLDALRACRDLSAERLAELKIKDAEKGLAEKEIKYYEDLTARLDARVKELEKIKCTEFSVIKIFFIKFIHFKKCN